MSLFKRPLLAAGASGFAALIAAALSPLSVTVALTILCATVGVICACVRRLRKAAVCLLFAVVALCSFCVAEVTRVLPLSSWNGKTVAITGTVTETGTVARGVLRVTVRVENESFPKGTKLLLHVPFNDLPPACGDAIVTKTALQLSDTEETLLFDSAKANGRMLSGWTEDGADFYVIRQKELSLAGRLSLAKEAVAEALLSGMTQDVRPLLQAMCLGDKTSLSDDVITDFRRAGVSHLLVVSGLHTSIIAMGLYGLLRKLCASRRMSSVAALLMLWAFALLVGFHPSVVRACVLNTLVLSGNLFRRRADGLNSLGGGLLILWLCNPFCVYDVGLWLSFGATFGLLRLLPSMTRACRRFFETHQTGKAERLLRFAAESLCVTLAATLPILPICALVFGEISLVAPLSNLLCVFAATLLLWCAVGALAFSVVLPGFLAGGLRFCATLLARYLLWATSLCSHVPFASLSTDEPYRRLWIVVTLCVVFLLWRLRGKRAAFVGTVALCLLLVGMTAVDSAVSKGKTDVTVKRAYGDVAVILERDGEIGLLIDGGNGWTAAKTALSRENVAAVDTVVLLDPTRKLARKWLEFNDAVSVKRYVTSSDNEKVTAALQTENETVTVTNGVSLFGDAVSVTPSGERLTVSTAAESYTIDLNETTDTSFRMT